jgi:uncharacterized membrane protein YwzB
VSEKTEWNNEHLQVVQLCNIAGNFPDWIVAQFQYNELFKQKYLTRYHLHTVIVEYLLARISNFYWKFFVLYQQCNFRLS